MEVNIREALNDDSPQIRNVVFTVLREYGLQPDPETTDKDLDDIEKEYFSRGGYFGVIELNSEIVATVGIYKISSSTCELRKMYCASKYRGKGIGKKLLEHSLMIAGKLGFSRVVLETASPLVEAVHLYKKYGFIEYTPEHLAARCDQAYELLM